MLFQLVDYNSCQLRKKISVEIQLLSYSFLIRLINQIFNLQSNYIVIAKESSSFKCNLPVTDDFDIDGCIMNKFEENMDDDKQKSIFEFIVYKYPKTKDQIQYESNEWCIIEDKDIDSSHLDDNFELIQI